MSYIKKRGILNVVIVKLWPDFIDAICVKTNRNITFQLQYKMTENLKNYLNKYIENKTKVFIFCKPHKEENMYWFSKISAGEHLGIMKKTKSKIAIESLRQETEKDYNPVGVRAKNIKKSIAGTGRNIRNRTGGKIANSILENCISTSKISNYDDAIEESKDRRLKRAEAKKDYKNLIKLKNSRHLTIGLSPTEREDFMKKHNIKTREKLLTDTEIRNMEREAYGNDDNR